MPFPASRLTDPFVCPMVTGVVPHVGGVIAGPGCPTVLIGKMPASVMGDILACAGPPSTLLVGSPTVLVGKKPLGRMTSNHAHGGVVMMGFPTVLVP